MKNITLIIVVLFLIGCTQTTNTATSSVATPEQELTSTPRPISVMTNSLPTLGVMPTVMTNVNEFVQQNCSTMGLEAKTSPDGNWLASACLDDADAHIRIARLDGTKAWELYFKDITGATPCLTYTNQYGENACFYGILYINHWYKDSRYVFIDADFIVDRAENFHYGLYRIDVETGQVLPYLRMNGFTYKYAFSADDDKYAYVTGSDNYLLHVVSIETGQDLTFTVPGSYSSLGELLWSPDNNKLVLVARGIGWEDNPAIGFSLVLFDIQSGKFTALISKDARRFSPQKWLSNDVILLNGFSNDGQVHLDYQLSISNNHLVLLPTVTPTP